MSDELNIVTTLFTTLFYLLTQALATTWGQVVALVIVARIAYKVWRSGHEKTKKINKIQSKTFKSADFEAVIHDDHVAFSSNKGQNWTLFNFGGCSMDVDFIFVKSVESVPDLAVSTGHVNSMGVFTGHTSVRQGGTFNVSKQSSTRLIKIKQIHPYQHDLGLKTAEDVTIQLKWRAGQDLDPFSKECRAEILPSHFVKFRTFQCGIPEDDTAAFYEWWAHHKPTAFTADTSISQKLYSENEAKAIAAMNAKYPEAKHRSLIMRAETYQLLGFCGLTAQDELIVENFERGDVERGRVGKLVYGFSDKDYYVKKGHGSVSVNCLVFTINKEFTNRLNYLIMKEGMRSPGG